MATATRDLLIKSSGEHQRSAHLPVDGGSTIYKGTLVCQLTATAMLVPAGTASTGQVIGMAQHGVDNTAGADGAKRCLVDYDCVRRLNNDASNPFDESIEIGTLAYAVDDNTVSTDSTDGPTAGVYVGMHDDGTVLIMISPALTQRSAAITALTDSSGGAANDTIAAISGSGADADINNNFADLAAKVNALIARG